MSWVSALQFDTCLSVDIFALGVKRSFAVNARVSRVGFSSPGLDEVEHESFLVETREGSIVARKTGGTRQNAERLLILLLLME